MLIRVLISSCRPVDSSRIEQGLQSKTCGRRSWLERIRGNYKYENWFEMDICVDVAAGLRLLGSPNVITEDCFTKLLEAGICTIADGQKPTSKCLYSSEWWENFDVHCNARLSLHFSDVSQLCNSKGDAIKECYAAILSLLVEAARHDTDPDTLSVTLLQNYNFSAQRSEKLVGTYRQHKTKLQAALSHIGTHPPHIIDASWTLDYCVKVSQHCKFIELVIQRCWCTVEVPAPISSSCLESVPKYYVWYLFYI